VLGLLSITGQAALSIASLRGKHFVTTLFDKLNLKDHDTIVVISAPPSFEDELRQLKGVKIVRDTRGLSSVEFAIAFVTQRKEADRAARELIRKSAADAILWFAYPKGTSKTMKSEVNRDTGWDVLLSAGFDTVRLVAIDADWSALRFRRKEHIGNARPRSVGRS
jgi:hypothetical protein